MENWYERIEEYNLGKLSAQQRQQFETVMMTDPVLMEAVRQHRAEWEAGELLAEKILREQIREQFGEHSDITGNQSSKHWKWIATIALLLLAALALFFINRRGNTAQEEHPSTQPPAKDTVSSIPAPPVAQTQPDAPVNKPERTNGNDRKKAPEYKVLAMAAYRTPDGLTGVRGTAGNGDSLVLAQQAFAKKNYRLALRYLTPLPTGSQQEGLALRGHTHFLAGDYAAARADFSDLLAGGVYIRDAQWFGLLADMTVIGANKKDLLQRLDAIRLDKYHPWQKDAAALWERLK